MSKFQLSAVFYLLQNGKLLSSGLFLTDGEPHVEDLCLRRSMSIQKFFKENTTITPEEFMERFPMDLIPVTLKPPYTWDMRFKVARLPLGEDGMLEVSRMIGSQISVYEFVRNNNEQRFPKLKYLVG